MIGMDRIHGGGIIWALLVAERSLGDTSGSGEDPIKYFFIPGYLTLPNQPLHEQSHHDEERERERHNL
jgi:hypothetical protein